MDLLVRCVEGIRRATLADLEKLEGLERVVSVLRDTVGKYRVKVDIVGSYLLTMMIWYVDVCSQVDMKFRKSSRIFPPRYEHPTLSMSTPNRTEIMKSTRAIGLGRTQ